MVLYFAEVIGTVSIFGAVAVALSALATSISFFFSFENSSDGVASKKIFRAVFPVFVVASIVSIFTPSKKTIYLMAAAKVSQDIIESPDAKVIGDKLLKAINKGLDEVLEDKK